MKKILFYDNSVLDYFIKYNNTNLIVDYFDIEVQKILHAIGFSFKRNPRLIFPQSAIKTMQSQLDYMYDLKSFDFSIQLKGCYKMPCYGIIFDCYL